MHQTAVGVPGIVDVIPVCRVICHPDLGFSSGVSCLDVDVDTIKDLPDVAEGMFMTKEPGHGECPVDTGSAEVSDSIVHLAATVAQSIRGAARNEWVIGAEGIPLGTVGIGYPVAKPPWR